MKYGVEKIEKKYQTVWKAFKELPDGQCQYVWTDNYGSEFISVGQDGKEYGTREYAISRLEEAKENEVKWGELRKEIKTIEYL